MHRSRLCRWSDDGHDCPQMPAVQSHRCRHQPDRIASWNSENLPIYEPGLDEVVKSSRERNLFFSTDIEKGIKESDIIFVSVNTPTKTFGEGAGMASDLQYWEKTARQILDCAESSKIIVEKSTLPVRTARAMERILTSNDNHAQFDVVSNPEFLAEGTAVRDLENPDRVLIGSRETDTGLKARNEIVEIYRNWVPEEKDYYVQCLEQRAVQAGGQRFLARGYPP